MATPNVHIDLHLVLIKEKHILLGRRLGTTYGADQYHVPAGRLEPNETIIDGVIREAREETGIIITGGELNLSYVMHFRGDSDRLSLFFSAERWSGQIANLEPEKCAGWEWHETTSLPVDIVPYAKHAIAELLAGRRVGLFGW
jgi:8-oxo-dGTP diphosphatase